MSGQSKHRPAAMVGTPQPAPAADEPEGERPPDRPTTQPAPLSGISPKPRSTGTMIANRYRLLAQVGADASVHAAFWRARDTVLERDVGLTMLVECGESSESARATDMTNKALRWGQFEHPGCARLLDVMRRDVSWDNGGLPDDVLGLAVTEWVPGQSLVETLAAAPLRTTSVLAMLDPLAQGAEAAHRQGLVLGCAHPQRIRITPDGAARLAFALPHPGATPADDVRGLGATLYSLLTAHWPLSGTDAELAGLPPAPRDVQDAVVPPGILRPGLSVEVSALTLGTLGAGESHGRVHTAAAVHKVLTELLATEREVALLPPPDDGGPVGVDEVWRSDHAPEPSPDPRRRKLRMGMGGLGLAVLAAVVYLSVQLGSLLGLTTSQAPRIVLDGPSAAAPDPGQRAGPPEAAGPDGARSAVVQAAATSVFDPTGDPDNTGRVSRAVDGDPGSAWSTYSYRQPFPALKEGVGIVVSFASPVQLSSLTITSRSSGSRIEVLAAPAPDAPLAQTVPMATANVRDDQTRVSLTGSQPVQHVLLWITKLGGGGDQNVTEIADLRFERATG